MKTKKRIIKVFSIFLLVICYYFSKSIYAVDLKFEANVNNSSALIRIFSKSFDETTSAWQYYSQNKTGNNGTYDTYAISFWGNKSSANYSLGYGNSTYDTHFGKIEATSDNPRDNLPSYSSVGRVSVSGNNSSHDLYFELPDNFNINTFTGDFYRYRSKDEKINSGYALAIQDFIITKNGLKKLTDLYYSDGNRSYVENGYLKIRFSLPQHTIWDYYRHLPNGYIANNAVHHTFRDSDGDKRQMMPHNYGYDWSGNFVAGGSILNYYDNWLYIPLAKLNNRTVHIRYMVKNENGVWELKENETKKIGSDAQKIAKSSVTDKDSFYIGGKIGQGKTLADAEANFKNSTNTWGWNQETINIGASDDEQHYVVELYYDYRDLSEYHLKTDGSVINPELNKTTKDLGFPLTRNSYTFKAVIPLYYKYAKYVHTSTESDNSISTAKSVTFNALNGADNLKMGDKHYVKFFYEYEPPRQVFVRHLVYNETTKKYEKNNVLTNLSAAIKDGEKGIYYLRKNGYNQRHYKCGDENYVDTINNKYNEQYTVDYSDTVKLDKSRTLQNEGIAYIYEGAKIQNDSQPVTSLNKDQTVIELEPKKVKATYVDFYYKSEKITPPGGEEPGDPEDSTPPEDTPTIDFIPKSDDSIDLSPDSDQDKDTNPDCKVVYVPSGEKLKAYITANTYRPYSLVYDLVSVESNGDVKYKLKKYDAYRFVDGSIQNNSESEYGYINSTEKKGVFNTNSDVAVTPNSNKINQVIIDSRNDVFAKDDINPNTITTIKDGRKTEQSDFGNENVHVVNYDKYNGVRNPAGTARYDIVSLVQDGNNVFKQKKSATSVKTANNTQVNVFTPAAIKKVDVKSIDIVNHSNQSGSFVIQKDSEFKVTVNSGKAEGYNNIPDTSKYIKYYWLVLDFDVKLLDAETVYYKDSKNIVEGVQPGQIISAGNLIKIQKGHTFRAIATNEQTTGDVINQFSNKLKAIAVTYNVTDTEFEKAIANTISATTISDYVDDNGAISKKSIDCDGNNDQNHKDVDIGAIDVKYMYADAYYFVEKKVSSKNIGRIYDFKVTDCLDVNLKNIFRKSENGDVNDLTGVQYFSGIRRLLVYGGAGVQLGANQSNNNNMFIERESEQGSGINSVVSKTILPLGPYKHVDQNYVQAPKMGYRISFDLKTSGVYVKPTNNNSSVRYIRITPSYYYISKDGKTFKENIDLYYKNSSGKYVNFEGSGYTIYFKPNDGYRIHYNLAEAGNYKDMSTKMEALKIGVTSSDTSSENDSFILTDSMMTYSDNNFVQAWYGEFKLPNSTIVIEEGTNINNPLTDGYVGVRFKLECVDKETSNTNVNDASKTTIVSYNNEDSSYGGSVVNTTQWDYEGFLGFPKSNIGRELDGELRIQLEKDFWRINSETYKKIKGTVVLYDIDNRAADDFN